MPCTNPRCSHALCQLQKYLLCPRTLVLVVILGIVLMLPKDEEGSCSVCCVYKMVLKTACGFLELCVHLIEMPLSIICCTKSRLNMILEFAMAKCSNTPCCASGATKPLASPPGHVPEKGAPKPLPPQRGPIPEKGAPKPLPPTPGPIPEKKSSLKKPSDALPLPPPKMVKEPPAIHTVEETKEDLQVPSARVSVVETKRSSIAPEPELELELEQSKETEKIIEPGEKSTVVIEPKKKSTTTITSQHILEGPEPELEETEPESEEPEPEIEEIEPELEEPEPELEETEPELEEPEPELEEREPESEEQVSKLEEGESESEEPKPKSEENEEALPLEIIQEPSVVKSERKIKVKRETNEPQENVTVEGVCKRYTPKRCSKCRCARRKEARKKRSFEQGQYTNKKRTDDITTGLENLSTHTDLNKHNECCLTKSQSKCIGTERCCRNKGKKRSSADSSGLKRSSSKFKNVKRPSDGFKSSSVFIPSSTSPKQRRKNSDSVQSNSRRKSSAPKSKHPGFVSHKSARSSILGTDQERASSKHISSNKERSAGSKSPSAECMPPSYVTSAESDRLSRNKQASANTEDSQRNSKRSCELSLADNDVEISESQTKWSEESIKPNSNAIRRRKSSTCPGDSKCSLPASLVDEYTQTSFIDEKTKDKMQQMVAEEQETSVEPKKRPCMCYHKDLCRDNCLGRREEVDPEIP